MVRQLTILALMLSVVFCCTPLNAEDSILGKTAPGFKDLPGVDDKNHSSSDFKDAKATIVIFTCNSCPVAKAYEDRFVKLQSDYSSKGVKLVAINVNTNKANRLAAMKKRAQTKKFNFPYLFDSSQKTAKNFGANCTPSIFLLDGKQTVVYVGAMDDQMNPTKVTKRHLVNAIDAVLVGKNVSVTKTRQVGCGIKWKRK